MAYNQNQQQGGRPMTTTHIRTLFSPGVSSLTIKFFNSNLSFQLMPFGGKDQRGRDNYDKNRAMMTTVNFEGASALLMFAEDILSGKLQGDSARQEVQCNQAQLIMNWSKAAQGPTTELILNKNGQSIPFTFANATRTTIVNGQPTVQVIETGLRSFCGILDGYLTGINADRHLDKLTEEFAKSQEAKAAAGGGGWQGGGYRKGGFQGGGNHQQSLQGAVDFSQFAIQG